MLFLKEINSKALIIEHQIHFFYISGQNRDGKVSDTEKQLNAYKYEENRIGHSVEDIIQDQTHEEELDTGRNEHRIILKQR